MKKVVFFVGSLVNSGGTERVACLLANELSKQGYDINFLSLYEGEKAFFHLEESIGKYSLFSQKMNFKQYYFHACKRLRQFVVSHHIDVVINVESMLALYSVPALILLNRKNICWEHFNFNVDLGNKLRPLARRLAARFCTQIVTLTERDKRLWEKSLNIKASISAIANPSPFEPTTSREAVRNKVILAAGRLTNQKGFDILIDVWSEVIKERKDWSLRIVGSGEDADFLYAKANHLGISNYIDWVDNVDNMLEQYSQADLYVMSSRYEGLPMVLIEALAFGLPIVSFDCETGPSEIITHECGWLCKDGDKACLAQSLLMAFDLVDNDKIYQSYSRAASTQCQAKFALPPIVQEWVRIIS